MRKDFKWIEIAQKIRNNLPVKCPWCRNGEIIGREIDMGGNVMLELSCNSCSKWAHFSHYNKPSE